MTASPHKEPNRLIKSTSPYLLQHAYNPVQWFEWGQEALTIAKTEDKPILVSIGYSSCHWCHVMERESFENDDIAKIMNEHFVCIKVDREERPDIDQIYMEAVQAMQQHGGWPLNVFLTPDQTPFFGGTYFPANSWSQLLVQIKKAFKEQRKEIDQSGEELKKHLQTSDLNRFANKSASELFDFGSLDKMFQILSSRFDASWGGLEKAPKFVMPSIWLFLLRYYVLTKNKEALHMVSLTLKKMSMGGLHDQVGGGFCRYSVDAEWFAPHFEKMLYDNAQLLSLFSEAYSVTQEALFKEQVFETIAWLEREMLHPDGGFYSALDADSEGEEGKFYTWTYPELKTALGVETDKLANYFQAIEAGNWEHGRNILLRPDDSPASPEIENAKARLLEHRALRIRPGLDDKVLTGWNAMLIHGLADAYKAFGHRPFLTLATKCMTFLETQLISDGKAYRAFKGKRSGTEGFLEDYALLIQAYTSLYQITFDERHLHDASKWCLYVMEHFYDSTESYFFFTSKSAEQLIARKKEIFDNVIPSSNSIMARNLYHLGILLDREDWKRMATDMTSRLASIIASEPSYMSNWGILCSEITQGLAEIVVVGKDAEKRRKELHQHFLPYAMTLGTETKSNLPLMEGRDAKEGKTMIYVCHNKTCKMPVESVAEAIKQLI